MKLSIIIVFATFAFLIKAFSQDVSYSGYLNEKISVSIEANSIHDAVRSIVEQSKLEFPDMGRINFVFNGQTRPSNQANFKTDIKNISFGEALKQLCRAFNQSLQYDYLRNAIVFTTVTSTGDDPSRKYHISNTVSEKLAIIWRSEYELIESLQKNGVVGNFSQINLTRRTFVVTGNIADLQYIDMLLFVSGVPVRSSQQKGAQ